MRPRVTLILKCGHMARRDERPGHIWTQVHCAMCTFLNQERDRKQIKHAARQAKKAKRKQKIQQRVEEQMAKKTAAVKKKMAPAKVAKKKNLKKQTNGKPGRKWFYPRLPKFGEGTLLADVMEKFAEADNRTLGENDLINLLIKEGLKADGKKTPKRLVKGVLRNLSRAGVIIKDRGRDKSEDDEEPDEDEVEDDGADEVVDDAADDDEDVDEEVDEEAEDEETAEVEKPKKKSTKKKTTKKKTAKK